MIDGGMKASQRRDKESVDKISAAIILQSYLDRTNGNTACPLPDSIPQTLSSNSSRKGRKR